MYIDWFISNVISKIGQYKLRITKNETVNNTTTIEMVSETKAKGELQRAVALRHTTNGLIKLLGINREKQTKVEYTDHTSYRWNDENKYMTIRLIISNTPISELKRGAPLFTSKIVITNKNPK
jgi:hypothetical protein